MALSSGRKTIFFDRTQNERGRIDTTYSDLAQLLKDNNFVVEAYTEYMILPKKIGEADVMIFGCPNSSKLRPPEIEALKKFVANGGGLFLLALSGGDRGLMNNLSKLSEAFGITFDNTAVKDDRNNAGLPTMPILSDIATHPATEDVNELLYPSGCSLSVTGKATVLVKTSDTSDPPAAPVIAAAKYGEGRVICSGSYEIFRKGGGIKHPGNKIFALSAFKWLSGLAMSVKPSRVAEREQKQVGAPTESPASKEIELTLRRLINTIFDLQKMVEKTDEKISKVESNIEALRNQFQDFAESTKKQLGVIIPAKQFRTEDENRIEQIKEDIKALKKEIKSVRQLREHIEERHASGAISKDNYMEQAKKLDKRIESLKKKTAKKEKELKELTGE